MTPAQVAALGAAQGVAEVVPVSSSAQLVLLPWLLGWEQPADRTTFAAGLHAGSCAGIAWAVRRDLLALEPGAVVALAAASVPAALGGLLAADVVEERLGRPPQLAALLATAGAVLWWADARAERRTPPPGRAPHGGVAGVPAPAALAGAALAQVLALAPGVSRSGATLTALRLAGVQRDEAQRVTLLMSLPVTAGAALLTLARTDRCRLGAAVREIAPGAVTAALAGATSVTFARRSVGPSLAAAAVYRLGVAAVVARRLVRKGGA